MYVCVVPVTLAVALFRENNVEAVTANVELVRLVYEPFSVTLGDPADPVASALRRIVWP